MSDFKENLKDTIAFESNINDEKLLDKILNDRKFFIETFLVLKTKNKKLVPFIFNDIQNLFYNNRDRFNIILKARQLGMSSIILALNFVDTILTPYTTTIIVAHSIESATNLFEITKIFYEYLPPIFKPPIKYSNRRELYFKNSNNVLQSLESRIFIGVANSEVGRSNTINNLHLSEYAFYKDYDISGLLEAVPMIPEADSKIYIESTPNGLNEFYNLWNKPNTIFKKHFFPWYMHSEYKLSIDKPIELTEEEKYLKEKYKLNLEQLHWRRVKISMSSPEMFKREYPSDDIECFQTSLSKEFAQLPTILRRDSIINYNLGIKNLNIYELPKLDSFYVMGVDVAENGRTSDSAIEIFYKTPEDKYKQVAEWAGITKDENSFADIIKRLSEFYNNALIVIERNNVGKVILYILSEVLQVNPETLFIDKDKKIGFLTTASSKNLLISNLQRLLPNKVEIYSITLGDEIANYSRDISSYNNKHFDRLIATMLSLYVLENYDIASNDDKDFIKLLDLDSDLDHINI